MSHTPNDPTIVPLQELPFKTDDFIKNLNESSKRTRQILVILLFTSSLITLAGMNAVHRKFNWHASKKHQLSEIHKTVYKHFHFVNDSISLQRQNLGVFIDSNENINAGQLKGENQFTGLYTDYNFSIKYFTEPDSKKRKEEYNKIGIALKFFNDKNIATQAQLAQEISNLSRAELEHIGWVRIPLLGITFHINHLALYSAIFLLILYYLLWRFLLSEYTNITVAIEYNLITLKVNQYYFYEFLSMQQVLFRPRKLFTKHSPPAFIDIDLKDHDFLLRLIFRIGNFLTTFFQRLFSKKLATKVIIFLKYSVGYDLKVILKIFLPPLPKLDMVDIVIRLPIFIYFLILVNDYSTISTASEYNQPLTYISFGVSVAFYMILRTVIYSVEKRNSKIDHLWDNYAMESNLAFILSETGTNLSIDDFKDTIEKIVRDNSRLNKLNETDKIRMKKLWCDYVVAIKLVGDKNSCVKPYDKNNKDNIKNVMLALQEFINDCLYDTQTKDFGFRTKKTDSNFENEILKQYWEILEKWQIRNIKEKLYGSAQSLTSAIIEARNSTPTDAGV